MSGLTEQERRTLAAARKFFFSVGDPDGDDPDVFDAVEATIDRLSDADASVSVGVDRDELLPIHTMWLDLDAGRPDNIPSPNARRAARLFDQFFRRAGGDTDPKVSVTDRYYVMDSMQARDVLVGADDVTDGGVSKTVARSMKALQRFTKGTDCDCPTIEVCNHGLLVFDDTRGTNRVRGVKDDLHGYGERIQARISADDDGEQPSEAPTPADAADPAEAADDELNTLAQAEVLTRDSDTVVSNLESEASDRPLLPDR